MSDYVKNTIKNWALEDRPREKLLLKGTESLSDVEILAIIIGSGTKNTSAVELSRKILNLAGNNLHDLGKKNISDLKKIKGIGNTKALLILAALELGRRRNRSEVSTKQKIGSSRDVLITFNLYWEICLMRNSGFLC